MLMMMIEIVWLNSFKYFAIKKKQTSLFAYGQGNISSLFISDFYKEWVERKNTIGIYSLRK